MAISDSTTISTFMIANPKARIALVNQIASEKPDAVQMSGDVLTRARIVPITTPSANETKTPGATPTSGCIQRWGTMKCPVAVEKAS